MLVHLLNIPRNPNEWAEWSYHHRTSHDAIRGAVAAKFGVSLTDYQVEPINPQSTTDFLQRNSQLHIDMDGVLGLQATDLQDVDLSNERELISWISSHYLEHYDAEQALGI